MEVPKPKIAVDPLTVVDDGEDYLELCQMCQKSRLTCENYYIRRITFNGQSLDGVAAGIMKTEEQIPIPIICQWFTPKDPG